MVVLLCLRSFWGHHGQLRASQETWLKERKITGRIYGSVLEGAWRAPLSVKFYAASPLIIRTALFDSRLGRMELGYRSTVA